MSELKRGVVIYECMDGIVVHDIDKHIIHIYKCYERVYSRHRTIKEVLEEL